LVIRTTIFVLASLPIVWVSRRSLLRPRSHGFSRFFAFEAILALVVVNAPYWFAGPLGPRQLVSWTLLVASIVLVVWGVVLLRRIGGQQEPAGGSADFGWESTEHLVTTGVYRYIRHPMYASLLFLAWGAFLKSTNLGTLALAALASMALYATAKAEEAEDVVRFGDEYRDYMTRTRRFFPFVF
jgi:protein-S-isoprenylcysteine O-methyltransferase Ste14